jgi:hypothetical protein
VGLEGRQVDGPEGEDIEKDRQRAGGGGRHGQTLPPGRRLGRAPS